MAGSSCSLLCCTTFLGLPLHDTSAVPPCKPTTTPVSRTLSAPPGCRLVANSGGGRTARASFLKLCDRKREGGGGAAAGDEASGDAAARDEAEDSGALGSGWGWSFVGVFSGTVASGVPGFIGLDMTRLGLGGKTGGGPFALPASIKSSAGVFCSIATLGPLQCQV